MVHLTVCSYHVTNAFYSESKLCSCLNVMELLARNRHNIWSFSDCNGNRTQYHLVFKGKLNCLTKLPKWLSCVVSTYLFGTFNCLFLSCQKFVLEWIYTLQLTECQETPNPKQAQHLKFKWRQGESNPQTLTS